MLIVYFLFSDTITRLPYDIATMAVIAGDINIPFFDVRLTQFNVQKAIKYPTHYFPKNDIGLIKVYCIGYKNHDHCCCFNPLSYKPFVDCCLITLFYCKSFLSGGVPLIFMIDLWNNKYLKQLLDKVLILHSCLWIGIYFS